LPPNAGFGIKNLKKIFRGSHPRTPSAGGADPLPHSPSAQLHAVRRGRKLPCCWDLVLGNRSPKSKFTSTPCEESARDNHVFCNLARYSWILKSFHSQNEQRTFLNWLLTTRPHFKYAATLLCNLSIRACFADVNVSTYARCGGIFDIHSTANLRRNLPVNFF